MQAFTALVTAMRPNRLPPVSEPITVEAENETRACYLAELQAREKWPGCTPVIRGVRPADCPHQQLSKPIKDYAGEAPRNLVHAETADKTEGLRDYDRPNPKPFAEWTAMPWFSLKKYALHAIKGSATAAPANKKEALVILSELGLVAP